MKKMYTNKPVIDTESLLEPIPNNMDSKKKIKFLEDRVRDLTEQVHKLATALDLNNRQLRRQNTDIHNISTVVRNKQ
jgi:hypothetical protein